MNHVVVTTAIALTEAQRKALAKVVVAKGVTEYELKEVVDANVIGGLELSLNGLSYDTTVAGKLQQLQSRLVKDEV